MKSMKKLVLAGLVLLASVIVLVGCKNDSVPEVPHEHSFADEWSTDGTHHWKAATCGHEAKSGYAEHTFSDWEIIQSPTEETEGSKEGVCNVCKRKETKVIEKLPKDFAFVPGGTIKGALPAWLDESASGNYKGVFIEGRTVTLSDFYMGKYEVTQEEYASVMAGQKVTVDGTTYQLESNPSFCTEDSEEYTLFPSEKQGKRPVEGVTWYDAVWYCNVLSEEANLSPAYNIEVTKVEKQDGKTGYSISGATVTLNKDANGYRLPTEAEWEYAARGGDPEAEEWNYTFSGANTAQDAAYNSIQNAGLDTVGWYWYNTVTGRTEETEDTEPTSGSQGHGTHQVGTKKANSLGIYDMSGNVFEWCYDWYGTIKTGEEEEPQGTTSGSSRVFRGGSWHSDANFASVSYRTLYNPYYRYDLLGFRVVCPSSK